MEGTSLNFSPVLDRPDLVPSSLYQAVKSWSGPHNPAEFLVAEIDPEYAGGTELCAKYGVDPRMGANCLVVEGTRSNISTLAVCLVPVGYRFDMSGVVRKRINARQVSVASLDFVISKTKMEYGSITPIGLPKEWVIFIDPLVFQFDRIIIGGGLKKSKLSVPSKALLSLPNAEILEGLAKKADN